MAERENAADHNEKRQKAMYADGPKAKNGKVEAGKKDGDDKGGEHGGERAEMHERHKRERSETHERHAKERGDMHKRHEDEFGKMNDRQEDEIAAAAPQDAAPLQGQASDAGANEAMGQGAGAAA